MSCKMTHLTAPETCPMRHAAWRLWLGSFELRSKLDGRTTRGYLWIHRTDRKWALNHLNIMWSEIVGRLAERWLLVRMLKTRKSSRVNWSDRPTEASPKIGPLINFLQRW